MLFNLHYFIVFHMRMDVLMSNPRKSKVKVKVKVKLSLCSP